MGRHKDVPLFLLFISPKGAKKKALSLSSCCKESDIAVLTALFSFYFLNNRDFTGNYWKFELCLNFLY